MFGSGGNWFFKFFEDLGRYRELFQKAATMWQGFESIRKKLREKKIVGSAGAGLVEIEMNALEEVTLCRIDPELLKPEEREFLEGLLVEAMNSALRKASEAQAEVMTDAAKQVDLGALHSLLEKFGSPPGFSHQDNDRE